MASNKNHPKMKIRLANEQFRSFLMLKIVFINFLHYFFFFLYKLSCKVSEHGPLRMPISTTNPCKRNRTKFGGFSLSEIHGLNDTCKDVN